MIESPCDFTNEERKILSSHATDAGKFSLENSPKAFDVVGVDFTTYQFAAIMIDIFMPPAVLWQHAIHFESIGIYKRMRDDPLPEQEEDEVDIELLWFYDDEGLARSAIKKADNGQFVGAMAFLGFDPPDMQTLVLALAADVRLIQFDRSLEDRHGIGRHANTKMVQHAQNTASRNICLAHDGLHRPLADKCRNAIFPFIVR